MARLTAENELLRRTLASHNIPIPAVRSTLTESPQLVARTFTLEQKVALFRSLFLGREDVYAIRWQASDGRSGYSPATERDWKAYNAARPEDRKRIDRETRRRLPLTDQVIFDHLSGKHVAGIYPMLADESCWLLAVDFDKAEWLDDATSFLETCRELRVPAYLERSRSGHGGHVWIFFGSAIPAILARKLGSLLLTHTMERRHQLGLTSYDRLFPNQDTMPKGGFGNLIALPLQKTCRDEGNAVFIDEAGTQYPDQWGYLSTVNRVTRGFVEGVVARAQERGELIGVRTSSAGEDELAEPWILPPSRKVHEKPIQEPLPKTVKVVRANRAFIEKDEMPSSLVNRILRIAAFQNPEFYKAQAMRLSTFGKPRVIGCGEDLPHHVALPRGCLPEALELLESHGVSVGVEDQRFSGVPIEVCFHGSLRETQHRAATEMLKFDDGVLCVPTAFGKTAVAAWLIAERKVNALVLVHRQQLLDQWRERLAMFLGETVDEIGQIGGGKSARTGRIDVAVIQSVYQRHQVKDCVAEYGHVIIDECHHLSAFTFEQVLREVKAKHVLGLTATPTRKDGHHPIIYMQCGPIRFSLSARSVVDASPFRHIVIPRETNLTAPDVAGNLSIQDVYALLTKDDGRNRQIANDVCSAVEAGRCPLVLISRTEHLRILSDLIRPRVPGLLILRGGMGKKQRLVASQSLAASLDEAPQAILATGSYIGEGFDYPRLDTLFLAMPISWKGTLQQYAGRLHRLHTGKQQVEVHDYTDSNIPMLARMFERRLKGYRDMGYEIEHEFRSGGNLAE